MSSSGASVLEDYILEYVTELVRSFLFFPFFKLNFFCYIFNVVFVSHVSLGCSQLTSYEPPSVIPPLTTDFFTGYLQLSKAAALIVDVNVSETGESKCLCRFVVAALFSVCVYLLSVQLHG